MKKYTKTNNDSSKRKNGSHCRLADLAGPADEIDAICRERLPDGVIQGGILAGREPEIRQETLIMVLSGYLEGHPGYRSARHTGNSENMKSEMGRCVAIAMKICKRRMESNLSRDTGRQTQMTEQHEGTCCHPYELKPGDWPSSVRASLVLRAADEAVKAGEISAMNAGLLHMIVSQGMNVEEISRKQRVSPSAVYQQLRRIRKVLPEWIVRQEF
jgi:hypothetical protein